MLTSTAQVATAKPSPYMKQLCKHFGHTDAISAVVRPGRTSSIAASR